MKTAARIAVIIPFYQSEPGILARALDSIRAQVLPPGVRLQVIVVDDASPVPAMAEMAGYDDDDRITWRSIRQDNAGPGGARNTGLGYAAAIGNARYAAFLDSDDEWTPDHLANAVAALDQGYDFYFSDHRREGHFDSYFAMIDLMGLVTPALWDKGAVLDDATRGFAPHALDPVFLREYLSQSSTVVLRMASQGHQRFDPELRHASEDRMMWIQIALSGARICVSTRSEVECGRGVNMFYESLEWDSPGIVTRLGSQLLFGQKLVRLPNADAGSGAGAGLREKRDLYSYLLVRNLLKGRPTGLRSLRPLMRRDPLLPLRLPFLFARFALAKRRGG